MRDWIKLFDDICSPEMMAWAKRWGTDSTKMEDQVVAFELISSEALTWCDEYYPVLYRGFGITEEQADILASGKAVEIPVHPLQSWTTDIEIAREYGKAAIEKGAGVLIKGHDLVAVFDFVRFGDDWIKANRDDYVENQMIAGESYGLTDAYRESEVVVKPTIPFVLLPNNVVEMY